MNVSIRLFAAARAAAGTDSLSLELPEGATIGQLRGRLAEELPEIADLIGRVMFALDAEYAGDDAEIRPDADVACIPPVSGG